MELIKMNVHTVGRRSIFYGLLLLLLVGAAGASDLTLSGDAHVNSARPDTNYGGITNLYIGNGNTSLLMFDVSAVPANTPATQVTQTMLRLYVNMTTASHSASAAKSGGVLLASWILGLPGTRGLLLMGTYRKRRRQAALLCCLIVLVALSSWACGGSPSNTTPPPGQTSTVAVGDYSVTVTANVVSEAAHSLTLHIHVIP
jgi:hypothetical protein